MANEEHLAILKQGTGAWNEWRVENPDIKPDFSGASLSSTDIPGVDLFMANLRGADLFMADLSSANLGGADLTAADLSGANLTTANLFAADLPRADLLATNLLAANLSRANLVGADLRRANLIEANLTKADCRQAIFTNCHVHEMSAWNLKLEGSIQENLVITPPDQPTISVDNLEVAQFISLLLNSERALDVINTITTKVALLLGHFTLERKAILDTFREALRQGNRYIPLLFDFDKPASKDTHRTITTLARLARFVIADITEPRSIPPAFASVVEQMPSLPVQPLLQSGYEPWNIYAHIQGRPGVLELYSYDSPETLRAAFGPKVIEPAESETKKRVG